MGLSGLCEGKHRSNMRPQRASVEQPGDLLQALTGNIDDEENAPSTLLGQQPFVRFAGIGPQLQRREHQLFLMLDSLARICDGWSNYPVTEVRRIQD
jgi:hypothetical protein